MINCPNCKHDLEEEHLQRAICPNCSFSFNIVITIPLGEEGVHKIFGFDCECGPRLKFVGRDLIIFHPLIEESLAVKWAKDIINQKP